MLACSFMRRARAAADAPPATPPTITMLRFCWAVFMVLSVLSGGQLVTVGLEALDDEAGRRVMDAVERLASLALDAEDAVGFELCEVAGDGGLGQVEGEGEFANGQASEEEGFDEAQAVRVSHDPEQRGGCVEEFGREGFTVGGGGAHCLSIYQ